MHNSLLCLRGRIEYPGPINYLGSVLENPLFLEKEIVSCGEFANFWGLFKQDPRMSLFDGPKPDSPLKYYIIPVSHCSMMPASKYLSCISFNKGSFTGGIDAYFKKQKVYFFHTQNSTTILKLLK